MTNPSLIFPPAIPYSTGKVWPLVVNGSYPMFNAEDMVYARNSGGSRINSAGNIEQLASNVPRLTYQLDATCPYIRVEGSSSNIIKWSEDLTQADWQKSNAAQVTVTSNATTSPDGTVNAGRLSFPITGGGWLYQNFTTTPSQKIGISFYFKNDTIPLDGKARFMFQDSSSGFVAFEIKMTATGPVLEPLTTAGLNSVSATIQQFGTSDWYRIIVRVSLIVSAGGPSSNIRFQAQVSNIAFFIWGVQVEPLNNFATSYIKTEGTSVSRAADVYNMTNAQNYIGQNEGSVFINILMNRFVVNGVYLNVAGTNNEMFLYCNANGQITFQHESNSSIQAQITKTGLSAGVNIKIGIRYGQNDWAMYVDGAQVGLDTAGSFSGGFDKISFYRYSQPATVEDNYSLINSVMLFKNRLTNAELQALTT